MCFRGWNRKFKLHRFIKRRPDINGIFSMTRTTLTYLINFSKKMKRNSIAPVKFEMEILFKLGLTN